MKLLLALGLFSTLIALNNAAGPRCHLSELWDCVQIAIDWLHSLPKRSIPETEEDVDVMCTEINKAMDCGFSYRDNCTTPLQKEVIGLLIEGFLQLEEEACNPGSSLRTKYLSHSVCLNKVTHLDEFKEQIEYALAALENVQNVQENEGITYICCGYATILNAFGKLGNDHCGKEAVDTLVEIATVAIAQLPEVICSGFDAEQDRCKAVLPPQGSKPSDDLKGTEIYKFLRDLLKNWLD